MKEVSYRQLAYKTARHSTNFKMLLEQALRLRALLGGVSLSISGDVDMAESGSFVTLARPGSTNKPTRWKDYAMQMPVSMC